MFLYKQGSVINFYGEFVVNKVFYINSDKFPAIVNDCQQIKERVENKQPTDYTCIFEALPPVRRTLTIPDKIKHGETTTALGMAGLALINLPEDMRDIASAYKQLNGAKASYDYKNYQHSFSFFKGTSIEEWLHKNVDADKKWANWLYNNDKSLDKTVFGEKLLNLLGVKQSGLIVTDIKNFKGNAIPAMSYSGSVFGKISARALRRTTVLGIGAMALLEVPKIIKSDEKIKQIGKSAMNVANITAGIGYCGAIGAKYGGSIGSLVGMGAGAILGSKLSQKIQEII